MARQKDHHSSKQHKYQIVIVPEENGAQGFSFTVLRWKVIAAAVGACLIIALVSISAIVFTPLGQLIPVSDAELSHRYGSDLVSLQERVIRLSEEMLVLRDYNRKLRITLGDRTNTDSLLSGLSDRLALSAGSTADQGTVYDSRTDDTGAESATRHTRGKNTQAERDDAAGDGGTIRPEAPQMLAAFRAAFPISSPVEGYITRTFQSDKMHFGVDYAGRRGTVIAAAADGYVIFSNWTQEDGNIIILSHGGGYATVYQHNQILLKRQGDFVKRGMPIALLGDSGTTSYGPHLHFEIWKDGRPQDPSEYLIASEK